MLRRRKKRSQRSKRVIMRSRNTLRHSRDFSFRKAVRNPMRKIRTEEKPKRVWWKIYVIMASILLMLGIGLYHPFFYVEAVTISGLERIEEAAVRESVNSIIQYKKFFILPSQGFFMVDVEEINHILQQKFPVESVTVQKTFPNKLNIAVNEKISTIIYDNGRKYAYMDLQGNITEVIRKVGDGEWVEITTSTTFLGEDGKEYTEEKILERFHQLPLSRIVKEMGNYPIIYDKRGKDILVNTNVVSHETASAVMAWYQLLQEQTDIPFGYIHIEDTNEHAILHTQEGWVIHLNLTDEREEQFQSLMFVLKEKVKRPHINYIDLRYGSQVYWQ